MSEDSASGQLVKGEKAWHQIPAMKHNGSPQWEEDE